MAVTSIRPNKVPPAWKIVESKKMRIFNLLHFAGCDVIGRNAMLLANVNADAAAASIPETNPDPDVDSGGTDPGGGKIGGSRGWD